jgi:osmotically-inducible protein OsmY
VNEANAESPEYLIEHVRQTVARDPRTNELDIHVVIEEGVVVLTGSVSTTQRHRALTDVVEELLPDHHIRNDTTVAVFPETTEVEQL